MLIVACEAPKEESHVIQYPDVLDLTGTPDSTRDRSISSFSDLGAWHSFALPETAGGFTGPFVMTQNNGVWLSPILSKLQIIESGETIDLSGASNFRTHYYPGRLWQYFEVEEFKVDIELIFVSNRSSLVRATIENNSQSDRSIEIGWKGENWFGELAAVDSKAQRINLADESFTLLQYPSEIDSRSSEGLDVVLKQEFSLKAQEQISSHFVQSVYFNDSEISDNEEIVEQALKTPAAYFVANEIRWNAYLEKVLDVKYPEYEVVAVKALETLINNWRSAAQDLHYDGLFPSYAYRGFHGVWSWDSWKHSVALVKFAPELAKDQIRVMYDYQDEMGMIADVIYRNKDWNNWRDTKPPLSVWAIWSIYEETGDRAFLDEMYPRALKYHNWWYQYRDHDQNGLAEYGSTDGTRIAAAWESGMDNAVRFDDAVMIKNNDQGWSLNQESVDLNAYLYAEKLYLAKVARVLEQQEVAQTFENDAAKLKETIQQSFYSEEKGYFYDKVLESNELKMVEGTEGWTSLWVGAATQEQAESVISTMLDTTKFDTYVPLPTFTKDHPKFNPRRGYWRGPVWLDQVYFGIRSLERYGYEEDAERMIRKLIENAEGVKEKGMPIRENYHPVTGEGLNARHFSWSAAHLLLLLTEK